ncbi:MAG: DNA-directed DNA polymerase II small subunit [Candidatus Micrarchaeia archaeon]
MEDKKIVVELAARLSGIAVLSNEVQESDLQGYNIEEIYSRLVSYFDGSESLNLVNKELIKKIMDKKEEKMPEKVEIIKPLSFKPIAKEYDAQYKIKVSKVEKTGNSVTDFASYFRDRYRKIKDILTDRFNMGMVITSNKISDYANGKEITVVGIVNNKFITKKGNLMVNIEDEEGEMKILFIAPDRFAKKESIETFESAKKIINDEIIAIKVRISSPFIIATNIIFPDIQIKTKKQTEEDLAIAFTSDLHIGSKLFLEKEFLRFIEWLNGNLDYRKELAGKVKYVVFGGDVVDGIGVYPEQDKELNILDIYKQYSTFFRYIEMIPDYIKIFVIPGNHDAVQRADPQPSLSNEIIGDFKKDNVNFLTSPSFLEINGLKVLAYHGTSLDSVIHNIVGCSYFKPEMAMLEILKRRHISPIYGENPINPGKTDPLVISEEPDILHMGHVHKNGSVEYRGTQIVNSGTWQARTNYQIKLGHLPTPTILPVYETKKAVMQELNFGGLE